MRGQSEDAAGRPDGAPVDAGWLLENEPVPRSQRREPLTRAAIVAAALTIVDLEGLEALTMRRLGADLGVGAMAVYRHVRNKDQLLDLLVEAILRETSFAPSGDWRTDAAAIARATRAGLMRHRRAVSLVGSRPWVGRAGLGGIDATIGVFRAAGLDGRSAVYAQFAVGNYVNGFCTWESASLGAATEVSTARAAALDRYRQFVATLPADRFPNLAEIGPDLVAGTLDERFEFGLQSFLDGIAQRSRESRRTSKAPAGS